MTEVDSGVEVWSPACLNVRTSWHASARKVCSDWEYRTWEGATAQPVKYAEISQDKCMLAFPSTRSPWAFPLPPFQRPPCSSRSPMLGILCSIFHFPYPCQGLCEFLFLDPPHYHSFFALWFGVQPRKMLTSPTLLQGRSELGGVLANITLVLCLPSSSRAWQVLLRQQTEKLLSWAQVVAMLYNENFAEAQVMGNGNFIPFIQCSCLLYQKQCSQWYWINQPLPKCKHYPFSLAMHLSWAQDLRCPMSLPA